MTVNDQNDYVIEPAHTPPDQSHNKAGEGYGYVIDDHDRRPMAGALTDSLDPYDLGEY